MIEQASKGENAHKLITYERRKINKIDKSYTRQMGYNTWLNMQQKMKRKKGKNTVIKIINNLKPLS